MLKIHENNDSKKQNTHCLANSYSHWKFTSTTLEICNSKWNKINGNMELCTHVFLGNLKTFWKKLESLFVCLLSVNEMLIGYSKEISNLTLQSRFHSNGYLF